MPTNKKIMLQKDFLKKYFQNLRSLITFNDDTIKKIINVSKIITEIDKNNKLSKLGDINFWVDSKAYNHIENVHQVILLSLVDLIIGKSEYPAK